MRTRFLNKLTNDEVEQYLQRNDLIFVPVGTIETHGGLPLDSETILAEAICERLAEQADGLSLCGLGYFYAGATMTGRGTIQISTQAGAAYLGKIAASLLRQGFHRQVYITFHGPSLLTVGPMVRDFFEKTKVPLLYIDASNLTNRWHGGEPLMTNNIDHTALFMAAYKQLGQLELCPLNVPESPSQHYREDDSMIVGGSIDFMKPMSSRGIHSASCGYYFGNAYEHGSTCAMRTPEEREALAERGAAIIDKIVERINIVEVVDVLRQTDRFIQDDVLAKYGDWMYDPLF